jgi:hypothetical protein
MLAVLNEIDKQIECLRANRNLLAPAPQLAPVDVKCIVAKSELHVVAQHHQ